MPARRTEAPTTPLGGPLQGEQSLPSDVFFTARFKSRSTDLKQCFLTQTVPGPLRGRTRQPRTHHLRRVLTTITRRALATNTRRALTASATAASPRGSPLCHPVVG